MNFKPIKKRDMNWMRVVVLIARMWAMGDENHLIKGY